MTTCSQYLASQSRGVQQLLLRGLFGKKWPTQDTTEGGMAKQPRELDPAHHATRAGSWITDGNYKMVLSATARQDMILRNFYQKANGCTAETTPWLLCRYTHYLAWPTNWGKLFGFLIKIEHITHWPLENKLFYPVGEKEISIFTDDWLLGEETTHVQKKNYSIVISFL